MSPKQTSPASPSKKKAPRRSSSTVDIPSTLEIEDANSGLKASLRERAMGGSNLPLPPPAPPSAFPLKGVAKKKTAHRFTDPYEESTLVEPTNGARGFCDLTPDGSTAPSPDLTTPYPDPEEEAMITTTQLKKLLPAEMQVLKAAVESFGDHISAAKLLGMPIEQFIEVLNRGRVYQLYRSFSAQLKQMQSRYFAQAALQAAATLRRDLTSPIDKTRHNAAKTLLDFYGGYHRAEKVADALPASADAGEIIDVEAVLAGLD